MENFYFAIEDGETPPKGAKKLQFYIIPGNQKNASFFFDGKMPNKNTSRAKKEKTLIMKEKKKSFPNELQNNSKILLNNAEERDVFLFDIDISQGLIDLIHKNLLVSMYGQKTLTTENVRKFLGLIIKIIYSMKLDHVVLTEDILTRYNSNKNEKNKQNYLKIEEATKEDYERFQDDPIPQTKKIKKETIKKEEEEEEEGIYHRIGSQIIEDQEEYKKQEKNFHLENENMGLIEKKNQNRKRKNNDK